MAEVSDPTCYNGIPCAGTCVEASSLQQKGDELAELEDHAGTDLCLSEHLHEVRLCFMLSSALWLRSHPATAESTRQTLKYLQLQFKLHFKG